MKLSIGYSPCPNDTFIFDALVHGKIDTEGLEFEPVLADVEALNQGAFAERLDITKLSYHALGHVLNRYALLHAGSALGRNCGPLLIARTAIPQDQIAAKKIAIPGRYTTANFLFSIAFPDAANKEERLFSDIENDVLSGRADVGLIIHESRFTFQEKGLVQLMDLGEYWEQTTGLPIPLGGIAVRRSLPLEVQQTVDRVLHRSVAFARQNPLAPLDYVRRHAQEMDTEVMYRHIDLYVNEFTLDLGAEGRMAVERLFGMAQERGLIPGFDGKVLV
ncbi:MAG: 1,4-dihydroxy-6-naphthoate synthase [Saprospiraceae bacterium]|nr:1,4-dihydroxy-6-naphthoate synthase [Saprospiraceae bacterium]